MLSTPFIKMKAGAGGKRKEPTKARTDAHPRDTEPPGTRPRGLRDERGRIAAYLIGFARAARGRLL